MNPTLYFVTHRSSVPSNTIAFHGGRGSFAKPCPRKRRVEYHSGPRAETCTNVGWYVSRLLRSEEMDRLLKHSFQVGKKSQAYDSAG